MAARFPSTSLVLASLAVVPALAVPLKAQTTLCINHKDQFYVVFKVHDGHPWVMDNGKLTPALPDRCALAPAAEFRPAFVSVRIIKANASSVEIENQVASINQEFHFAAYFTSPYRLKDVFFVLEMQTSEMGSAILYNEIDDLEPGKPRYVDVNLVLMQAVDAGHFTMHVYSEGAEVFNSQQPWEYREGKLDQMVRKRIEGVKDASPQPFFGPAPEFPAALQKSGVKGRAVLSFRITKKGAVLDPVVESTTDPAFGEAALAAVRVWRFLPKVVDGVPVESKASVPFVF
jgi:TonB family protein